MKKLAARGLIFQISARSHLQQKEARAENSSGGQAPGWKNAITNYDQLRRSDLGLSLPFNLRSRLCFFFQFVGVRAYYPLSGARALHAITWARKFRDTRGAAWYKIIFHLMHFACGPGTILKRREHLPRYIRAKAILQVTIITDFDTHLKFCCFKH